MALSKPQISLPAAALAILSMATMGARPAAAQSQARVEVSANVGALTGGSQFNESETFPVNAETETVTANHGGKTAIGFDVGGAVRLISHVWFGVHFSIANNNASTSVTAIVPHPLLFNAPRTVQGSMSNVAHNEQNVHLDVMYALPITAVEVKAMAGPTFFNLSQDFVSGVTVNETYPFDTATFASAKTNRVSKGAVGFNAGVDISHAVSSAVGIGALIRYSRADVTFAGGAGGSQTIKAGGFEAAAGVRVSF